MVIGNKSFIPKNVVEVYKTKDAFVKAQKGKLKFDAGKAWDMLKKAAADEAAAEKKAAKSEKS